MKMDYAKSIIRCSAFVALIGIFSFASYGYEFYAGDVVFKPVAGATINVLRYDKVTRETPKGGMTLGLDVDYLFSDAWAVTAGIRPVFSSGFIELGILAGAKYRLTQTDAPFIPYASLSFVTATLFPVPKGAKHVNIGLRPAVGIDYFVLRNLTVGLELAVEPSVMLTSGATDIEMSIDALFGVAWRM